MQKVKNTKDPKVKKNTTQRKRANIAEDSHKMIGKILFLLIFLCCKNLNNEL